MKVVGLIGGLMLLGVLWQIILVVGPFLIVALGVFLVVLAGVWIYHNSTPERRAAYLKWKEEVAAEAEAKAAKQRSDALAREKEERYRKANERKRKQEEAERKERERISHRDADTQSEPYTYQIGRHGNESLAIRYGIANQERKVKEYWYYAKGGERTRNPDRDRVYFEPASTITVRKLKKLGKDLYEVSLTDYRDRKARAIIETGTEYIKTFYPPDDAWFKKHAELETTLKGNGTFTLKELATFHVQKTVGS